jgi:hypothetical protein
MKKTGLGAAVVSAAVLLIAGNAGAQVRAGGEFIVNTTTVGAQLYPSVGRGPDGGFVVAWSEYGSYVIKGQRFDRSGARQGPELTVSSAAYAYYPSVAVGRKGDFVVAWSQYESGSSTRIAAQRFDAAGARRGPVLAVSTAPGPQIGARLAIDGRGDFVVTWWNQDGSGYGVAGQRFDSRGQRRGAEFQVNAYVTGTQNSGDVAADASGNFVVAWSGHHPDDGDGQAVNGQRYDASGAPVGAAFLVNTYTTGIQGAPSVAMSAGGGFVIAYLGQRGATLEIFAQRFDAGAAPLGGEFQVNTATTGVQSYPTVALDTAGNFVVAWLDRGGDGSGAAVRARRFLEDGGARGDDFVVNTYTTGDQISSRFSSVAAGDQAGNFVVAWVGHTPAGQAADVYAQRFGGVHPTALAVDSGGNQVWEAGETVDVRPFWLNAGGSGVSLDVGGVLARLTGPAGPAYTIPDGAGAYPLLPDGGGAPCSDCYQVGVSAPAMRPATHWDATAVETIVPDAQGQAMRWSLHVGGSFGDVPAGNPYYRLIETLLHHGVTAGCSGTHFCPRLPAAREQMAVFVLAAREGAGYTPPACGSPSTFADVPPAHPFCPFIEELARRGVVNGCGGGNYCPGAPVTREQMAVFTLRTLDPTLDPPACGTPVFADVPASSPYCRWIEDLARRQVVAGCGGGNYCPATPVTREQMSVFIAVTFGLTLYGPA